MIAPFSRKWCDYVILAFLIAIASYLLFVPPIVGIADQGDYSRITWNVGLEPPANQPYEDTYVCWLNSGWRAVPVRPLRVFSTAEFPIRAAILLHKITGKAADLDIRLVSAVYLAILGGLALWILKATRKLPGPAYVVIAGGLALVCTNSPYLAYFNSFYSEPAALLGVLAFAAAALWAIGADPPSWTHLAGATAAAAFLAGSKAQNAVLGILAAIWMVCLFRSSRAIRLAAAGGSLAVIWLAGYTLSLAPTPEVNLFNAIYDRVLPNSSNPQATLTELGLKPTTASWSGKQYWTVKIASPDEYPGSATRTRLALLYLRHPVLDLRMADGALSFSNEVTLGSYVKNTGAPCLTRNRAFVVYDRFRTHLASIWFLLPFLAANLAAVCIWRNRTGALFTTLAAMAAIAFLIAAFFDTDPRRHLFTFNLLFDVLLFADLSAVAVSLSRIGGRWAPRVPKLVKPTAALVVCVLVGMAAWRELPAKAPVFVGMDNLALRKAAAQSSTLSSSTSGAGVAVDGNPDGNFFHGSVSSTNLETSPWWEVDLGASRQISSVVIRNRTDCCSERLSRYWVFISDEPFLATDTPITLRNRPNTWKSFQDVAPAPFTGLSVPGLKGRYVRIQLDGLGYLSLAEVEVLPSVNLALGRSATQSSDGVSASAAVDGNGDGNYMHGSVSSTNRDPNAWWQVDLGESRSISSIRVWNRSDCCPSRLSHYWVFLSDTPFAPSDTPAALRARRDTWSNYQTDFPDPSITIDTHGARGRYVRVQLDGTDYLSIAEVEVFGE